MTKKLVWLVFVPVIYFACRIGWLATEELNAPRVYVAVKGYDPRDLLAGQYLMLEVDWRHTDCAQFEHKICPEEMFERFYRYYVPETAAQTLERLVQKDGVVARLEFIMPPHAAPRIMGLTLDNRPWQELLKE